ncbi:40-residue YVTN family beta-propeller repeat-containing protein [Kushneria avicenniae]|uniref:40-residue YVTN family beta-propeller repeat-containing protein n=2 Tax=Kushneria avicenniae TaxID=402385 RepID=A0A1I1L3X1_9GAMM|nr:40-residue YVTN family beta-propeller repeat-containing protein [Kushneria avicenniae]
MVVLLGTSVFNPAVAQSDQGGSAQTQSGVHISKNVQLGGSLYELVFDPDTRQVLVADAGGRDQGAQSYLYRLDAATLEVVERIALNQQVHGLALDQQRDVLYMVDTRGGTLTALDAKSGKTLKTLTLVSDADREGDQRPPQPRLAAVDEDSNLIYVTGVADQGVVWVVNGDDMTLANTFKNVGSRPAGLALDTEHQRIYVTLLGENRVAAIDTDSGEVVKTFDLEIEGAINVVFDSRHQHLLVTGQKSGELEVLDAETGKSLHRVSTGEGALDVGLDEDAGRLYVTNRGAGTVSVLDAESLEVIATFETGPRPNSIAIDPGSHDVFVTNRASREAPDDERGNSVTLIKP